MSALPTKIDVRILLSIGEFPLAYQFVCLGDLFRAHLGSNAVSTFVKTLRKLPSLTLDAARLIHL